MPKRTKKTQDSAAATRKGRRAARGSEDRSIHVISLMLKFQRVVADMKAMTTSMERLAHEIAAIQKHGTCGSENPPNADISARSALSHEHD